MLFNLTYLSELIADKSDELTKEAKIKAANPDVIFVPGFVSYFV